MKNIIAVGAVFLFLLFSGSVLASEVSKGPGHAGIKLLYEGFNLGSNGVIRFSLECAKNWGGQVGGIALVSAFYLDDSGLIVEKSERVSCHVSGGLDGATHKSNGGAKNLKIPVSLSEANVRAYLDYKETTNIADALKNIENSINQTFEEATRGIVKQPLTIGQSLEQAVAPTAGYQLAF